MKICILTSDEAIVKMFKDSFDVYQDLSCVSSYEVVVLVSYGRILPKSLISTQIFLNVHNSLLPKYRGRHAFTWAIINGDHEVGYTLHLVTDKVDAGNIIDQVRFTVMKSETINDVFVKAKSVLVSWLIPVLKNLNLSKIQKASMQDHSLATYVPRRTEKDNLINWTEKSDNIYNLIRSVSPPYTPGAFTYYKNSKLYISNIKLVNFSEYIADPGKVLRITNEDFLIKTGDSILLLEKQMIIPDDPKFDIDSIYVDSLFGGIIDRRDIEC